MGPSAEIDFLNSNTELFIILIRIIHSSLLEENLQMVDETVSVMCIYVDVFG